MSAAVLPNEAGPRSAAGFTLLELCTAMAIFGVLAGIAITPMHRWMAGERQGSTTAAIEALFRETQQRAVTEGRSMCVSFDVVAQTYSMLRGACGSVGPVRLVGPVGPDSGVRLDTASFAAPGGGTVAGATFYPRGTATPGQVRITRAGADRVDTLLVEGLTGRVSRG